MATKYLMGLDAGSEGCRCLIVDLQGQAVAFASRSWSYETPGDLAPLGREFDPRTFWRAIAQTIQDALAASGASPKDILAVSATSQREGLVFLDAQGQEIYAGPNVDLRAFMEGMALDEEFGQEIYAITGHRPSFLFAPAKLRWFCSQRPKDFERIACALPLDGWVTYRLCGEAAVAVSSVGEVGLLDISQGDWSERLRKLLDLPSGIYPPLGSAGARVGVVTPRAAQETGLAPGTPVALGGADTQCGLLGMGVYAEGQGGIVAGWSASLQLPLERPLIDKESRIWTGCHAFPGRWVVEGNAGEVGSVYRWLKDILFPGDGSEGYVSLEAAAQASPLGAEGTLALLGPQLMDMGRLGLRLGGFLFPVPRSLGAVSRGHLARAFLENLAFALRANCAQLEAISGIEVSGMHVGGGLSRSHLLGHILAHVLYRPVKVSAQPHVSTLGAAMAAGAATVYSSLEEACQAMLPPFQTYEPEALIAAEYQECYGRWQKLAQGLEQLGPEVL
ncbi:MAG: hypothetical protein HY676_02225 [Chloroflexi bacterium]|nr:hypothetical protein [Chloroflexota bacterium]